MRATWGRSVRWHRWGLRAPTDRRGRCRPLARSAHDMGREFKVLSVLYQAYPLAPQAYLHCADPNIIGAEFFVMDHVDGVVYRNNDQLAALTGALLIGFEIVLTHWSYFYLSWFFPFAAFAVLASPSLLNRHTHRLAASGAPGAVAFDEDAFDSHVAGGGLEPDRHAGDEAPDRTLGDAPDH